ncbi:hypothetical protein AALC17_05545 [Oscillospiraceae bacterium 38-13]
MINDEKIIEMFFERSEQGIRELDIKYGKVCHKLSSLNKSIQKHNNLMGCQPYTKHRFR